jgi:hypothetical protein
VIYAEGKPVTDEVGRAALRAAIKLPRAIDAFYARLVPALKVCVFESALHTIWILL